MKNFLSVLSSTLQGGIRGGLLILALLATTTLWAYDFQSGDLYYNITSNSTVEVTEANNTHSITIPRTVTYDSITYIVTRIGETAFYDCSSLTSISIPNSITSIGYEAFFGCSSLTSITIPKNVTSIGYEAFSGCSSLTKTNYTGDIAGWCNIKFGNTSSSNPIFHSHNLYINGQEIKNLVIPNTVDIIHNNAFCGCSSLTSVTIPNSVTSIGYGAFARCSSLTSINIPNSVTSIGNGAFMWCTSLTSIKIPNGIASIENYTFYDCSSLTSINIPNSITSIGDRAFYCNNLEEIYCYPTTPPDVTEETFKYYNATLYVPCDSKETYEAHPVFGKFEKIKGIDDCGGGFVTTHIHETICQGEVYEFGEYLCDTTGTYTAIIGDVTTFLYLTVLPSSIDTITVEACDSYEWRGQVYTISGDYTFYGDKEDSIERCHTEILHLTISKSKYKEETIVSEGSYEWNGKVLTESGDYVSTLKTVNGCDSILELHLKIVPTERENNIIYYTSNSGEVITPYATDVFGANILSNTYENGLGIITFDGPVTQIGHSAFSETNITSIVLPNTVTSIGHTAFCYCYYLTSIVIPNTVTRIGWSAFSYCYDLTSINIPSSVTFIDEYAFDYCESLTSIEIPEGVKSIKQHTFFGCDRLESVVIPNSVQSIGDYAFFWCSSLNSINLPNKLRTIGEYAFRNCPFTSITIPKSVTKIKDRAFNVCKELVSIVVEDGNTTYDSRNNCNAIIETGTNTLITGCATTTIPDDIVSIADGAFYGCNSLGSITIPNSVTKIGNEAFRCSIDTIYCYAITPPELYDEKVFDEYDANLNVPCSSLEAYKSDSLWGKFTNIQCFETTPPSAPQDTTIYHPTEYATICEGTTFVWMGMEFTEIGTYTYEEIVEDENYVYHYIHTLELQVIAPPEPDTIVVEAYDSYEWHGVVYTESGTYIYEEHCYQEILQLTIIPSEDKEYVYGTYYQDLVCNGGIYVDPITGENYLISSLVPTSLTWSDTVKGTEVDTIHTFNITPIVSPEPLTEDMLYAIGSVPKLVAGEKVDIAGTTELIMEYYQKHDKNDIADVIGVEWVAGHDVVLDTEQTTHTMVLEVWDECDYRIPKEFTFPVSKKDSEPQDTTIYHPTEYVVICEGDEFYWRGRQITEAGTHINHETVEDENYIYHIIYTLELTVIPFSSDTIVVEAYDSYEWHGVVYTESGVYLYEEYCFQEILHLTIIPSEDKEYVYEHHNYLVCDADIFVDPITGSTHVISSLIPFSLTWSDTIIGTNIDTIHTFNITPIVYPEPLTEDMLYAIGAVPKLVAGEKVDLMGTTELIMAYYQMHDQHDIADVTGVEWVAGHDVVLDAEQTTHTMVLEVWDECDDIIPMEFTFPVSKKDSEPQDTTIYIYHTEDVTICEGETYIWWMGKEYTEEGIYTYEEIVVEDDYIHHYIYTLHLMVLPPTLDMYEVTAYDSYEWHGVVYTESGVYTYSDPYNPCVIEELHLTIIDTPTIPTEYATICEGETYIWRGKQITEAGTYIYEEIVEDEDYTYHHTYTLELTVLPYETIEYEVEAYDSYVWHDTVYTESGTYTYQYECTTEVLYLTIIPSEDNQGEVVVEPSTNSVTITWQKEDDADTYIIVIKQGDKVVCTLIFDAEGNLVSVNYLPGRESNKHGIQHAGLTSDSFQYTITGLTPSTDYTYTVTATDDSNNTISSYSGEFTTHHATSVENTNSQSPTSDCQKILYEDHIYILRDGKIYSIMGQEM